MKCKISKGDYAKLSYKLIFREWQSCKCQITREYSDFFFRAACVSGWKKKHLSCVITRLENHHHSNFYQAASILCWVKFTRTFKLSPDSTWDMIKTEVASRIQTSIEDSKQKRNLTEILLFCIPVVPFLICSFKQYFWSVFGQGLSTVQ